MAKQRAFSGIQPSGQLHIGNYLGAIKQWIGLQDEYECVFSVVDYHALTVSPAPDDLRKRTLEVARIYLAAGVDPERSIIFKQSDVPEHAELAWVLGTLARMSDLYKMTQFKDKGGDAAGAGVGLFAYPVLMAADILLYNTEIVPVGEDQVQHVELARELARRFNRRYGGAFVLPQARLLPQAARVMGLDNPEKKMSKSAKSAANRIELAEAPAAAKKKIMRATTDSGAEVRYDPAGKPGISNLLAIHSLLSGQSVKALEARFRGQLYGPFKQAVADSVSAFLTDFQSRYGRISEQEAAAILSAGAEKARAIAARTMAKVRERIGVA